MTERESELSDPEVPIEDALEQRAALADDDIDHDIDIDVGVEGATSDAALKEALTEVLDEADPADRAEQGRVVAPADDEYR
ncbi:MAG TPA: hypothetical protein VF423_16355 [Actinomycetes bacterium]